MSVNVLGYMLQLRQEPIKRSRSSIESTFSQCGLVIMRHLSLGSQSCRCAIGDARRIGPEPEPVTGLQFNFCDRSQLKPLSVSADVDCVFFASYVNERYKVFLFCRRRRLVLFGIMIARDDDHKLENNPGRVKALEAAAAINGVAIFP